MIYDKKVLFYFKNDDKIMKKISSNILTQGMHNAIMSELAKVGSYKQERNLYGV